MLYGGQADQYAIELIKKYGEGIIEEINSLRNQTKQFTIPELEELIKVYKEKIKQLELKEYE